MNSNYKGRVWPLVEKLNGFQFFTHGDGCLTLLSVNLGHFIFYVRLGPLCSGGANGTIR